ncbi:hypothetical protein JCM8202_004741 [Rhodotorula sphaerocarpa]
MKFSITAVVLALATAVSAQTIATPNALYTCEPYQVNWSGGQGPYYVRVLKGTSNSDVIETLVAGQSQTSYTWDVNVAAGTSVHLSVTDATGQTAASAPVTIQQGASTSCVGLAASGSSASAQATGSSSLASSQMTQGSSMASGASSMTSMMSSMTGSSSNSMPSQSGSMSGTQTSASGSAANQAASSSPTSGAGKTVAVSGLAGVAALAALFA